MDVLEAIRTRRTIAQFRSEPIPADILTDILSAGVWAPNHHLTEPWTFFILGPEAHGRVAARHGELRAEKVPAEDTQRRARVQEESVRKFMVIPSLVAVVALQEGDEQRRREDFAATCCAIQNVQLAAWAEGVGVKWSSGPVTRDPLLYELLDIAPDRFTIVGLLQIGYPAETPTRERKRSPTDVIRSIP